MLVSMRNKILRFMRILALRLIQFPRPVVLSLILCVDCANSRCAPCLKASSVVKPLSRNLSMSLLGGLPKKRAYSLLNWEAL